MRLEVTRIAQNGNIVRRMLDTTGRTDVGRWESLLSQVPASPPPYRPMPGDTIYQIGVDDGNFMVTEGDLTGGLQDLVMAVLAEGDEI
jgi:hypothetical protein